jgi:hypothetical protein
MSRRESAESKFLSWIDTAPLEVVSSIMGIANARVKKRVQASKQSKSERRGRTKERSARTRRRRCRERPPERLPKRTRFAEPFVERGQANAISSLT